MLVFCYQVALVQREAPERIDRPERAPHLCDTSVARHHKRYVQGLFLCEGVVVRWVADEFDE